MTPTFDDKISGKTILITGGTGSFGSKFIGYALKCGFSFIRSYSRDEHKIQRLREKFGVGQFDTRLGDIRDKARLKMALEGVDYVIHAAALKQAPFGEIEPTEFAKTNVYGTQNLIEAVLELGTVKKVLFISTDKAVQPINLYGATKMLAERMILQANNLVGKKDIKFSCTRYGNVAGSRSTIVPIFLALKKGDPVPITNLKATRFWIGLKEANEFVLRCLLMMEGREIFIPKIPSVKVPDIAKALCPGSELKIIGDRDGDKLHEILISSYEKYNALEDMYIISQKGKSSNFEYSSDVNKFLSVKEIKESVKEFLNDRTEPFSVKIT